ncbi:MAG: gamma-glutamyl-gamma-aminobutyrate hydrolase family protein [Tissierellia bacterium]|nr:gamma-glutamyl-gamma-aminobutyrate hydrolase family protein [Tissierellia bacterium]
MANKKIAIATAALDTDVASLNYIDHAYINMVTRAGATPFLIPNIAETHWADAYLDGMDALILPGGEDVSPFLFGENPLAETNMAPGRSDDMDIALYRAARKRNLPILGVCRGMQIMNVLEGGSLWQDLALQVEGAGPHDRKGDPDGILHYVYTRPGSFIHACLGAQFVVNSLHHQAIKELAPTLIDTAKSQDGLIEAIEGRHGAKLWGTQFHIERLSDQPYYRPYFENFLEAL